MKVTKHDVEKTIKDDIPRVIEILQRLLGCTCPCTCLDCIYSSYCIHDDSDIITKEIQ